MKFGGQSLTTKNQKVVGLKRDNGTDIQTIELLVSPIPFDFTDKLRARGVLKETKPPVAWKMNNGKYVRDPETKEPLQEENRNDPTYVAAVQKNFQRMQALMFRQAVRNDTTIEFSLPVPADDAPATDWEQYADAMVKEVYDEESGLTQREVDHVVTEAINLSVVVAKGTTEENALKNFS